VFPTAAVVVTIARPAIVTAEIGAAATATGGIVLRAIVIVEIAVAAVVTKDDPEDAGGTTRRRVAAATETAAEKAVVIAMVAGSAEVEMTAIGDAIENREKPENRENPERTAERSTGTSKPCRRWERRRASWEKLENSSWASSSGWTSDPSRSPKAMNLNS